MTAEQITELRLRAEALNESERAAMRDRDEAEERVNQVRVSRARAEAALREAEAKSCG